MRILFFHRWVGVHHGGTETHIRNLVEGFARRGHEVWLLTRVGPELPVVGDGVKVVRISKNPGESDHSYESLLPLYLHTSLFMLKAFWMILYLIIVRRKRFDVISVHFVTEAFVARVIRSLFGIPYVFVLEGYTALEGAQAQYANLAIAISQSEVSDVLKNHGYQPIFIPIGRRESFNALADGRVVRARYLNGAEKMIICVSRIEPRKDHQTLIQAARIIKERGLYYRWLIVGEGIDGAKVSNLIAESGLSEEITMTGAINDEELPKFYRASDLFVLPTLYEGFGIVFIEAMSCGLPVVSTRTGAVPEVVDGAGIVVSPQDPGALASEIIRVLSDPQLYASLSSKALKRASGYSWGRLMPEYEKAYLSLVKK